MKIALVYPPSQELNLKGYPLGLGYLSSSLKRRHKVDIYDYNSCQFRLSLNSFFNSIKQAKPDLVGVSFNSFNRWGAYKIIRGIKKISKDIIVVLGGVHPSTMYEQMFRYFSGYFDFIIQSEGEGTFYKLCNALESGEDYAQISGLVYKAGKAGIKVNPVTEKVSNLDDLAMPDYSYASGKIKNNQFAYLITSRGCPVNCSFCSTSSFWGQNVRMNSVERVGEEVEYVKSMGAKRIFFHDDTFNLGIERTIKMAETLKKLNVEYAVQCRVTPVNEEMIARLVDSGCRHIIWGVESLSEKILSKIKKNITREQVKKVFDICARYSGQLSTSAFFCVGTPGESEDTIDETVEYLNKNIWSTHGPGASMLYVLPGTRIYSELVKSGKFDEKIWAKSGSVLYYTKEHDMKILNYWRKKINNSGIRLPFNSKYFLDYALDGDSDKAGSLRKSFRKIRKKLSRFTNMLCNRY